MRQPTNVNKSHLRKINRNIYFHFQRKYNIKIKIYSIINKSSAKAVKDGEFQVHICPSAMIYIAGSNLFGQWSSDDCIFNQFRAVLPTLNKLDTDIHDVKVLQINWSYNILDIDKSLYLSGACNGKERQCVKIPVPQELSLDFAAGNDYNIIMASSNSEELCVTDLNLKSEIKKMNLNIEVPLTNMVKKNKIKCGVSKVAISNDSCLYLTTEGHVYNGLLPSYVDTSHCMGKILDIQCGYEHFMLLTDIGRVYTWGNGRRLQLGNGDISNVEIPTEVDALAGIKITKISAGGWHSLALSEFGDLYAWGWNDSGQLGIKEMENQSKESLQSYGVPTLVDLLDDNGQQVNENIKDIACGSKHSVILLEGNSVWTTGNNKYGQLAFSEEKNPSINYFKKAFQCNHDCMLICGPWTTMLLAEE